MKLFKRILFYLVLLVGVSFLLNQADLFAKEDFTIKRIKTNSKRRTTSKSFSGGLSSVNSGSGSKWAEIQVDYDSDPKWVNEATIIYTVLLKKGNQEVMLSDSFTYQNIAKGQHFDAIYIHPHVLDRYGKVDSVAVEIWVSGELQDRKTSPKTKEEWWNKHKAVRGNLRVVFYTPFILDNPGEFEMLKAE